PLSIRHPAHPEIYTLSLHDALPISERPGEGEAQLPGPVASRAPSAPPEDRPWRAEEEGGKKTGAKGRPAAVPGERGSARRLSLRDRKSTRLNSSHLVISYAVFCLKK